MSAGPAFADPPHHRCRRFLKISVALDLILPSAGHPTAATLRQQSAKNSDNSVLRREVLPSRRTSPNGSFKFELRLYRRVVMQDGRPPSPLIPHPVPEAPLPRAGPFICSENRPKMTSMSKSPEKPFFHITLSDRDEWAVEAEWSDSTLERVSTFGDFSAADWIASQSEAWLTVRRIQNIAMELIRNSGRDAEIA